MLNAGIRMGKGLQYIIGYVKSHDIPYCYYY